MERYELVEGTASKYWQWAVRGSELKVEYGRIGAKGRLSVTSFDSPADARQAAKKLVREKVKKGYAPVKVTDAKSSPRSPSRKVGRTSKAEAERAALPAGLTSATLKALAQKIEAAADRDAIIKVVKKAVPNEKAHRKLYWYLITEGLGGDPLVKYLVWLLDQKVAVTAAEVPAIAAWLTRSDDGAESGEGEGFFGWPELFDGLIFHAYRLAPDVIDARAAEYNANVRRALAFIRSRADRGAPSREVALEILAELAAHHVVCGSGTWLFVRNGKTEKFGFEDDGQQSEALREVALRLGNAADWDAALVDATRRCEWSNTYQVGPMLRAMPLAEVAQIIAKHGDDSSYDWRAAHSVMFARKDAPAALLAAARALDGTRESLGLVRQMLALIAAFRLACASEPVPIEVAELLEGLELLEHTNNWHDWNDRSEPARSFQDHTVSALRGLPARTVHDLVRRRLDDVTYGFEHLVLPLVAHFDESLLERLFLLDDQEHRLEDKEAEQLARIGLPLLGPLARIIDATPHAEGTQWGEKHLPMRLRTYAMAFAQAIADGHIPDARFDAHIRFDVLGPSDESSDDEGYASRFHAAAAALLAASGHDGEDHDDDANSGLHDEAVLDLILTALPKARRNEIMRRKAVGVNTGSAELPEGTPLPPFEGFTESALRALVPRIAKVDEFKIEALFEKASRKRCEGADLAWYFVRHDLLRPEPTETMIGFLEDHVTVESAPIVAEMLARLVRPRFGYWMRGWSCSHERIVWRAYALAPDAFRKHEAAYPRAMQLGLAFIRGRRGEPIAKELATEIVRQLARRQATDPFTGGGHSLAYIEDGEEILHDVETLDDVRRLALRFGDAATWDRFFTDEVHRNQWKNIRDVSSVLVKLPLELLLRRMASRYGDGVDEDELHNLLTERGEPREPIIAAAKKLPSLFRHADSVLEAIEGWRPEGEGPTKALETSAHEKEDGPLEQANEQIDEPAG